MQNSMEKLAKPLFIKKTGALICGGISSVFGVVPSFIPAIADVSIFNVPLNWLILIIVIFITIGFAIIRYTWEINNFYKAYESQFKEIESLQNNNNGLQANLERKQEEIDTLKHKYIEYEFAINNIISRIQQGVCDISFEEKKYLKNLYSMLISDKKDLIIKTERGEKREGI